MIRTVIFLSDRFLMYVCMYSREIYSSVFNGNAFSDATYDVSPVFICDYTGRSIAEHLDDSKCLTSVEI